jgi:hypothetical protein
MNPPRIRRLLNPKEPLRAGKAFSVDFDGGIDSKKKFSASNVSIAFDAVFIGLYGFLCQS